MIITPRQPTYSPMLLEVEVAPVLREPSVVSVPGVTGLHDGWVRRAEPAA